MRCAAVSAALKTPAQLMAHVQTKGSSEMQAFVVKHQGRLATWVEEAWEWDGAEEKALDEKMTGWERVQQLARKRCECVGGCTWQEAAESFFQRRGRLDVRPFASWHQHFARGRDAR